MRDPAGADHLTDLDARFEGHLGALRQRADRLRRELAPDPPAGEPPFAADDPLRPDPNDLK